MTKKVKESRLKCWFKKPFTWLAERSAKTGRFVKKGTAEVEPETTVTETMKRK